MSPPNVQAQLVLHTSEEHDFKTMFSYSYETFEQYDSRTTLSATVILVKKDLFSNVTKKNLKVS